MRGQVYPIGNFRSGLDYRGGYASAGTFAANANDPDNVPERGRAREAVNVTVDANGVLRRRKGCWTAANWAAQTWSWAYMVKNPSTVTFPRPILLAQSLDIYSATYSPYAATTSIGGAFAPITSVGNFVEAAVSGGQGPLYGNVNGGTMVHWTGTGNLGSWTAVSGTNTNWSYLGSVPVGTILYYHLNRVWIATGNTLYWSDIGDPRVWPTQNVIKLDPDDGDQITGLAKLGTNLIVFKRKKIYLIYDDVTGYNRTISTTIGANAPKSIAETPQGIMFMDRNSGPCVTDGKNVTVLGDPVMPALYTYYDSDRTTKTLSSQSGAYHRGHYYLGPVYSPVRLAPITLDYDLALGAWFSHSWTPNLLLTGQGRGNAFGSQSPDGLYGCLTASNGFVGGFYSLLDSDFDADGQADGTLFQSSAEWWSGWQEFRAPHLRKRLRRLRLTGRGGMDVLLATEYDDTNVTTLVNDGLVARPSGLLDVPINGQVAHAFSVRVRSNSTADTRWAVNSLEAAVTMRQD